MNAVDPEIDVAFGREVALAPAGVLLRPGLLEAPNGRGRTRRRLCQARQPNALPLRTGLGARRFCYVSSPSDREPLTTFGYRAHLRRPTWRPRCHTGAQN